MKKVNVLIVAFLVSIMSWAQPYEQLMQEKVLLLDQKTEKVDLVKLSEDFETISKSYKKESLPKYYEALCIVLAVFEENSVQEKEALLKKVDKLVEKGIKSNDKDSEWYVLKALMYQAAITVNPKERGYSFSQKAEVALAEAYVLDQDNPRYYFLKGQNVFYTPEQYGGGKAKAKPLFEKAEALFQANASKNVLRVHWGQNTNLKQLQACQ